MRLADKLIQLRKQKGWTQAIAARNIAIQQSYLSKLENGRFIPSEDVIEKLCSAYDISRDEFLISTVNQQLNTKYWILSLLLGVTIVICGYTGLIFPQTYYTYKTSPLGKQEVSEFNLNYHLSDKYNGERYVTTFSSTKYEYVLIAERDILRKENRWLILIGLIMSIFSIGYLFISRQVRKNTVSKES